MKLGCVAVAYHEERFIPKYIQSMKDRVDEVLVLVSKTPWFGDDDGQDNTAAIATSLGATVIEHAWENEQSQRNAGQEYLSDCDWIIVLDPDEYLLDDDWERLVKFLETAEAPGYVTQLQHTYWKRGYVVDPPEDYKQIIAVKPSVRFVDKRVVNCPWGYAPTDLHHFSWARTDQECWRKITHYAHAHDFDTIGWFSEVWQSDRVDNLHPLTPEALRKAVPVELPDELVRLNLWP